VGTVETFTDLWGTPTSFREELMEVMLVSWDGELSAICREIFNKIEGLDYHLTKGVPGSSLRDADLYIWDSPSKENLPGISDQRFSKHLFLLNRNEVADFHENLGSAEAAVLLKPVSQACLSAFLRHAASSFQGRGNLAHTMRADRDEMLQCLIQANLQLQEYDQDRTNFLTRAVHDFRAPLTATGGYCGLLLSEELGPTTEEQKEVLRRMQHSVKRLSRMSSAMFELSAGRHIRRQPDLRRADIRDCVEQALHEITPQADGKNISLSVEIGPESSGLYLESGQIEQVLVNLLENACKFTPRSGTIEITGYPFFWERRGSHHARGPVPERHNEDYRSFNAYRIDIVDSGPRIPREHLENIFEEYTSYAGGHDRSGCGLGLAICRMIMTAHDGCVWAENTENGPRFSIVLPMVSGQSGNVGADKTQLITSEAR